MLLLLLGLGLVANAGYMRFAGWPTSSGPDVGVCADGDNPERPFPNLGSESKKILRKKEKNTKYWKSGPFRGRDEKDAKKRY